MKKFWGLFLVLLLVACKDAVSTKSPDELLPVKAPGEANIEEVQTNPVANEDNRNAVEELNWIMKNNENLHSPPDNLARLIDYNTGKPLGISIYYELNNEFDSNRYTMNIKLRDIQGQFVLGWHAPNAHAFYLKNTTPLHSISESRTNFIEISNVMTDTLYDSNGFGDFKQGAFVQITASDIDNDNALEFIFYGLAPNKETTWQDFVLEIYEYFPEQQQPFERVLQIKESVYSGQPIKITPAGEILIDFYRGEEYVVALSKDNEWYIIDEYYQNTGEHSGNRISYDTKKQFDFKNAWRSEQNIRRAHCKQHKCENDGRF